MTCRKDPNLIHNCQNQKKVEFHRAWWKDRNKTLKQKKQKEKGYFRRVQVLWNRWSLQREKSLGKKRVTDVSSEWSLLLNSSPKLGLMGKITSSRKGMRHYQSTLTCLDMHLGNQSQIQIWNSDGTQKSQNKWSRISQMKADIWRCCWTELTPASMSLQERSCGDPESKKLEHFSLSIFFFNVSDASFPVRTVSLKHIVGIHCKEFSRKWDILVCFISNCETDREIFILSGPIHWEFPSPLFHL